MHEEPNYDHIVQGAITVAIFHLWILFFSINSGRDFLHHNSPCYYENPCNFLSFKDIFKHVIPFIDSQTFIAHKNKIVAHKNYIFNPSFHN